MKEDKNIFVTGAGGFVASHLIPLLIQDGYFVTALVRNRDEKKHLSFKPGKVVIADLAKRGQWQNELKAQNYLIHLAAQISSKNPKDFTRNNVLATKNLIAPAKKFKVKKIILFSSASVTSLRQDPYSKTKKEQEQLILKSKIECIIIRPSMMYGPGDTKNIGWLIDLIKRLPIVPLPGHGSFGRQPVYIGDISQVVLKLLKSNKNKQIYEIHGAQYIPLKNMVETINETFKLRKIIIPVPIVSLKIAIFLMEKILPNPKFTSDQIDSLISGERFQGEEWAKTFGIIPTKFKYGIQVMAKK